MHRPALRRVALAAVAGLSVSLAAITATPAAAAPGDCTVAAVGDIAGANDYTTGAAASAAIVTAAAPDRVIALGDLAYDSGTATEFSRYYRPSWGPLEPRVLPIPGNHEYRTAGAAGYAAEFDATALDNRGVTVCGWRVVLLNQYRGIPAAATFLRADAAAHPGLPIAVAWHAPRYSSGGEHGNDTSVQPLWEAAAAVQARIVLNAHDHNYERFAPMTATGAASATGVREFVSGLGGHNIKSLGTTRANSEKRYSGTPTVLFLALNADGSYGWSARSAGNVVRDSGTQPALAVIAPPVIAPPVIAPQPPADPGTVEAQLAAAQAEIVRYRARLAEIAAMSATAPGGSADKTAQIRRINTLANTPV